MDIDACMRTREGSGLCVAVRKEILHRMRTLREQYSDKQHRAIARKSKTLLLQSLLLPQLRKLNIILAGKKKTFKEPRSIFLEPVKGMRGNEFRAERQ